MFDTIWKSETNNLKIKDAPWIDGQTTNSQNKIAPFVAILKHTFQTDTAQSFVFQIATSPTITVLRLALLQPSSFNHRSFDLHILQASKKEPSFNMRSMENYAQIWSAFWCRSLIHPSTYRKQIFPYRMVS